MKISAFAALTAFLLAAPAFAASPEEDYIAARKAYVKQLNTPEAANKPLEELEKVEKPAIADLQARLVSIVGKNTFKGVAPEPAFNPATLLDGNIETGDADGLRYASEDGETAFFVTSEKILLDWAKGRASDMKAFAQAAKGGVKTLFATDDLYTFTLQSGAGFTTFAALPVTSPDGTVTRAALGVFAQDIVLAMPSTIVVATAKDGRVVLAMTTAKTKLPVPKECVAAQKKQTAAFTDCITKRIKDLPQIPALTKEAEALLATARGN
jgi:hypothetical protein